jgi:hypothetical protein
MDFDFYMSAQAIIASTPTVTAAAAVRLTSFLCKSFPDAMPKG